MAEVFEFGIGLTATDEGAVGAIHGLIDSMRDLEGRTQSLQQHLGDLGSSGGGVMNSLASGAMDVSDAFPTMGAIIDPTSFEVFEEIRDTLVDTNAILLHIADQGDGVTASMGNVVKETKDAEKAAKHWADELEGVPESLKKSIKGFEQLNQKVQLLGQAGSAITGGNMISELEHRAVRLTARMGEGRESALKFANSTLRLANDTMISEGAAREMASALAQVGIRMDDVTSIGGKNAKTILHLSDTFGLGAEQTRRFVSAMKVTGGSVKDLAAESIRFEKKFKVPGLVNQLPAAAEAAVEAQMQFASATRKSSTDITNNIQRMTGVFAKALGKTAAEASDMARKSFMKFTGEVESFEDVFLGLADDFSPLQNAFLETGMGLGELQDLMKKGQDDPAAFAERVKEIRDQFGEGSLMGERFFRQVLRNSPEAVKAFLTQEEALKAANKAQADLGEGAAAEDPAKVIQEMTKAMRENAKDAKAMFENVKGVTAETAKLNVSEGVRDGYMVAAGAVQTVNDKLISMGEHIQNNEKLTRALAGVMGTLTVGGIGVSALATAFGAVSGALGPLAKHFNIIDKVIKPVSKKFKAISRLMGRQPTTLGKASKGLGAFGKIAGKIAVPVAAALAAFEGISHAIKGIGAVLSDPNATGMEKFKGVVTSLLGGIGTAIDAFFLGLPGKFIEGFMNVGAAVDTSGTESVGKAIGNVLGTVLSGITTFFAELPSHLSDGWGSITEWWASLDVWNDIGLPLISGLAAVGQHIIGFFKGVGGGILEAFGVPAESIGPMFEIGFLKVQKVVHGALNWIADMLMASVSGWKMLGNEIDAAFWGALSGIQAKAEKVFSDIVASAVSKVTELVKENPTIASWLGIGEAEVAGLQAMEAAFLAAGRAAEGAHSKRMEEIESERTARNKQIIDEQEARESASDAWSAGYDAQIEERQKKLNALAEEQARSQIALPTTVAEPGGQPEVATPAARVVAAPTGGEVIPEAAPTADQTPVSTAARAQPAPVAPAAEGAAAAAAAGPSTIVVQFRPGFNADTHLKRWLAEMEFEQLDADSGSFGD